MSSSSLSGNNVSIYGKVKQIKRVGMAGSSLLAGVLVFLSLTVYHYIHLSMEATQNVRILAHAEAEVLSVTLGAMDAIVDKDEGAIANDRKKEMQDGIDNLKRLSPEVTHIAEGQNRQESSSLKDAISAFEKDITLALPKIIEGRAGDDDFAALDDRVDRSSEQILDIVRSLLDEELSAQVQRRHYMEISIISMLVTSALVFAFALLGIRNIAVMVEKSIVRPFSQTADHMTQSTVLAANNLRGKATDLDMISDKAFNELQSGNKKVKEVSVNIQSVSSATEELVSSIGEIRRQSEMSAEISGLAVKEADNMSQMIAKLNEASASISEITILINKIAEGTNLLALNATIEAARAGEYGKGFAVVATEVKNLAIKTGEATSDITDRVSSMQEMSKSAVAAIENIRGTINDISIASSSVMTAVNQQSQATQEISHILSQVLDGVDNTVLMVEQVNGAIESTRQISRDVVHSADEMLGSAKTSGEGIKRMIYGDSVRAIS
ncbi:MAG: methyl-accepting chemotaxis protein [Pseudobdellovibrionaceae bacterium]|jgi:methyl-accepting chemotaxis protein|nr:methyl-accepting chemotaxis protein [Pseudobdellovibrionaceae bacterium]